MRQVGVIAEGGNFDTRALSRLEEGHPRLDFHYLPVYGEGIRHSIPLHFLSARPRIHRQKGGVKKAMDWERRCPVHRQR